MKKSRFIVLVMVLIFVFTGCAKNMENSAPPTPASAEGSDRYKLLYESKSESESTSDGEYNYSDEEYLEISENKEKNTSEDSLITFSLKVDTASYRNVVRYINDYSLPPTDAVRIEEMINYFTYEEKLEENDTPFSIYTEIGKSPFDENKNLAFIRVKSKDIEKELLPSSNLTFLIDTSGSMNSYDKLPLLKSAYALLVENLDEDDRVSIVTYAGSSQVVIDSVPGSEKDKILNALFDLQASGSTAGADGINTAYKLCEKNFMEDGNNRVILATDGDFNVGVSSVNGLENLIKEKSKTGIYLSILGFGTENIKDNRMETLSKYGSGNYSYIDSVSTAKKVLVDELRANLFTIADDVKAQVEFNPNLVSSFRLIGYENRHLENKDFEDDKKDAGDIGIDTDVILMFEFKMGSSDTSTLKYQPEKETKEEKTEFGDELFEVRIRYKTPGESESKLITNPVQLDRILDNNTNDFNFASSVAQFGHLLRDSEYAGNVNINEIIETAESSKGEDNKGYRKEYLEILNKYKTIQ